MRLAIALPAPALLSLLVVIGCAGSTARDEPWPPLCEVGALEQPELHMPEARVDPVYPLEAQQERVEGWVVLEAEVRPDGSVRRARVRDSFPRGVFDRSAVAAVERWSYGPGRDPRCALVPVKLVFALEGGQIARASAALQKAHHHLALCEFSEAAAEARRRRSRSRNPQLVLEAALIEAAALEQASVGSAHALLESYVEVAPDTDSVAAARARALRYVPVHCPR